MIDSPPSSAARWTIAVCAVLLLPVSSFAAVLGPGDIAFVGFNADGNDDVAFVTFVDLMIGQRIHLHADEWTGTKFAAPVSSAEGSLTWEATTPVPAGSVVVLTDTQNSSSKPIQVNTGQIIQDPNQTNNLFISAAGNTILAYTGTPLVPSSFTFLAAISNKPVDYDSNSADGTGTLLGTGLTLGTTALLLNPTNSDIDGGEYRGVRTGLTSFGDYNSLIQNITTNWVTNANGESVLTNGQLDATAFTIPTQSQQQASVPEAETHWLFALAVIGLWVQRRRC